MWTVQLLVEINCAKCNALKLKLLLKLFLESTAHHQSLHLSFQVYRCDYASNRKTHMHTIFLAQCLLFCAIHDWKCDTVVRQQTLGSLEIMRFCSFTESAPCNWRFSCLQNLRTIHEVWIPRAMAFKHGNDKETEFCHKANLTKYAMSATYKVRKT